MRLSTAWTAPPVALPPYSGAAGPRGTSSRSTTSGSIASARPKRSDDASTDAPPLSSTRTRSQSRPRIARRLPSGPNQLDATPGSPSSVSPSVAARRSVSPSRRGRKRCGAGVPSASGQARNRALNVRLNFSTFGATTAAQ
jgi:hypothetical protein